MSLDQKLMLGFAILLLSVVVLAIAPKMTGNIVNISSVAPGKVFRWVIGLALLIFLSMTAYRHWSGPGQASNWRMRETTKDDVPLFGKKSIFVTRARPQSVYIPKQCRLHWYTKGPITIKFPSGKMIDDAPGRYQEVPEDGGLFTFWGQDERPVQVNLVWDR